MNVIDNNKDLFYKNNQISGHLNLKFIKKILFCEKKMIFIQIKF